MKISVLLSAGRHPVSDRPRPVPDELRAIRLGRALGEPVGLHAGPSAEPAAAALGHGIAKLHWLRLDPGADAVEALARALEVQMPDLILAGRRAEGAEDSGLLPYLLAARLDCPIAADAAALAPTETGLAVEQALPGGARRRIELSLPAIVTVGPAAPAPLPFAYAARHRGEIVTEPATAAPATPVPYTERPYRRRPRLVRGAPAGGNAMERLRRATEVAGGGRLMIDPSPEEAAAAILAYLDSLQLAPGAGSTV